MDLYYFSDKKKRIPKFLALKRTPEKEKGTDDVLHIIKRKTFD